MPVGNINNNVRMVASATIPRNLSAENLRRTAENLVRRDSMDESEAQRAREDAQMAQGMAAVALSSNPINQRMQNVQQEEPAEQEARNILKQISARHYTAENFNTSGLSDKLGDVFVDENLPDDIRQQALCKLGDIYFGQPQEFKDSGLSTKLVAAFDKKQPKNIRQQALSVLGMIYNGSPQEFNQSEFKDKLGDALISKNPDIRKNALMILHEIYGRQAGEASIYLYNDALKRKYGFQKMR